MRTIGEQGSQLYLKRHTAPTAKELQEIPPELLVKRPHSLYNVGAIMDQADEPIIEVIALEVTHTVPVPSKELRIPT